MQPIFGGVIPPKLRLISQISKDIRDLTFVESLSRLGRPQTRLLCCMEICPPEKLTNVSHFISRGLFCNYQKDVAARRAATSMFWFKENQRPPLIRAGPPPSRPTEREIIRSTRVGRMISRESWSHPYSSTLRTGRTGTLADW